MPFNDSIFNTSTRCNSSPASLSGGDGFTPNKRLNSWAETRNLSIDTETIVANVEEREREKRRRLEEQRRVVYRNNLKSRSSNRSLSVHPRPVLGCFSFLPICRKGFGDR
jgi:hypothetical protein